MNLKVGLIGPGEGLDDALEAALARFVADDGVRQILYLGMDGAIDAAVEKLEKSGLHRDKFLSRGAELACWGSAQDIEALLEEERSANRMDRVRKLPDPPARAVEMLDRWIVLSVYDKGMLDEDDIANAHVVLYGHSREASYRKFGPRGFFTPGPVNARQVGMLEVLPDGAMAIRILDLEGKVQQEEVLQPTQGKFVVTP